jgi:hypothetical protein
MRRCALICLLALAAFAFSQSSGYDGTPPVVLSNGKLELTVELTGATLVNLALLHDPSRLSPFWNEAPAGPASGGTGAASDLSGHFLSLDDISAPGQQKSKTRYGEARTQHFEVLISTRVPPISVIMFGAQLPSGNQLVTRMVQMVDGENVAYIETQVDNLQATDQSLSWAEHAMLGPPFFEPGKTIIGMPGIPETAPDDLARCRIDAGRAHGYVAALSRDNRKLFGYVFRRQDFPWLISYAGNNKARRGIEFSTQPFDVSRSDTVDKLGNPGAAEGRRLAAKSRITARFLLFYTRVPDDFNSVSDVVLENKLLTIRSKTGQSIVLRTMLPL